MLDVVHVSMNLGDERGGVMAMVAVTMPVLLLFVMMVVEFGNFFEHRRHLQLQADAGALAGAGLFNHCFTSDAANLLAANDAIEAEARRYGGANSTAFNQQVGNATPRITQRINRKTFQVAGPPADDTVEARPCTAKMLDVKMTEADLPLLMRGFAALFGGLFDDRDVDAINARARIEIQELAQISGTNLPLAVPDPNPRIAAITFVNESGTGDLCAAPPCTVPLVDEGVVGNLRQWRTAAAFRITVPSNGAKVGVRVQFGGGTSTACGDDFVACYEGLALIRGFSAPASAPSVGAVWPITASCLGASFVYQYPTPCAVGVAADLDFGPGVTLATLLDTSLTRVRAVIRGDGLPNAGVSYPMTWSGGVWSTEPDAFTPQSFGGPYDVSLEWEIEAGTMGGATCTTAGNNPCDGTYEDVQRIFSGSLERSGSVRAISVSEPGSTATGSPLSLSAGDHDLNVAVGTYFFKAVDVDSASTDETVVLRLVGSGSNNFAIDCDAGRNLAEELAAGCQTPYQRTTRVPGCPAPAPMTPADCVNTEPGGAVGQMRQGMRDHFAAQAGCPANGWGTFPLDPTDPRIVPMILTDFGSFIQQGQHEVAVRRFGAFYITGWDTGPSFACASNEPYPFPESPNGDIWGHFIHSVSTINNGGGDPNALCNFDPLALDACIAVLTR